MINNRLVAAGEIPLMMQWATQPGPAFASEQAALDSMVYGQRISAEQGEDILAWLLGSERYGLLRTQDAQQGHKLAMLAALCASNAPIVICDEPAYGFDPADVAAYIHCAATHWGKPLIVLSHDDNFLNMFAATRWSLDRGRLNDR